MHLNLNVIIIQLNYFIFKLLAYPLPCGNAHLSPQEYAVVAAARASHFLNAPRHEFAHVINTSRPISRRTPGSGTCPRHGPVPSRRCRACKPPPVGMAKKARDTPRMLLSDFLMQWTTVVAAAGDSPPPSIGSSTSGGRTTLVRTMRPADSTRARSPGRLGLWSSDMGTTLMVDMSSRGRGPPRHCQRPPSSPSPYPPPLPPLLLPHQDVAAVPDVCHYQVMKGHGGWWV